MADDRVDQVAGNVGAEPEEAQTSAGAVVRLRVAVTKSYKNKLTAWVRVSVFNDGLRNFIMENIHTGSAVVCEGYMKSEMYNDKPQHSMVAYRVGVVKYGVSTPKEGQARPQAPDEATASGAVVGW